MLYTLITATEKDADLLAKIHEECFPTYWDNKAFTDFFTVSGTHAVLAMDTSPPNLAIGMMVWRIQHEQADILTLAVRPGYRRQGFARQMLEHALTHMQNSGVQAIFLDVEQDNAPAIRLYEAYGFSYVRRRRLYYRQKDGTHTDALVMTKKLSVLE